MNHDTQVASTKLMWKVAAKMAERLGGTLDDLFAQGVADEFESDEWESAWLIVGPPLLHELDMAQATADGEARRG